MTPVFNDTITEHFHTLDAAVLELDKLAGASHLLGLDRMASSLDRIVDELSASKKGLRSAYGSATVARLTATEQATANMISAALAAAS